MVMVYDRRAEGLRQITDWLNLQQQGYQQRHAQNVADAQSAEQQQQAAKTAYLTELIRANPSHAREIIAANADQFTGVNYDPSAFTPTADEQRSQRVGALKDTGLSYLENPSSGQPTNPNVPFFGALALTGQMPKSWDEAVASQAGAGSAGVAPAMRVATKLDPTGGERLTVGEASRHNQIEEGQQGPVRRAQAVLYGAETARNVAETSKIGAERRGLDARNKALTSDGGLTAGAGDLSKEPAIVQMLVKRTYDPTLMRRFKPDEQEAVLDRARQYDPNLNLQDYPRMYAVAKSFTSGPDSKNKKSLNTAIGHLHDLWRASSEIDNFDSIPLLNTAANALKNRAALSSGKGKGVIDWNAAVTGVSGELAALYKGGIGTDAEIKEWRAAANPNYSDEQRQAAVQQLAHMVGARFDALGSNYEQTGRPRTELLDAKAAKQLRDIGIEPSTFEITGPGSSGGSAVGVKTVTRAELQKMGSTEQDAAANGYQVVP